MKNTPAENAPLSSTGQVPAVYAGINKVALAMSAQGISKDRPNQQQGYKFRGIDDVYNALSRPLCEAGIAILPRVLSRSSEWRKTAKGGDINYVAVHAEFDVVSSVDGSKHTVATFGEAMDTADKATNKAMSAAFKYACMQVFCIPTEGDNDADATTHELASREFSGGTLQTGPAVNTITAENFREHIVDIGGDDKCNGQKIGELNAKWLKYLTEQWLPWAKADTKSLTVAQRKTMVAIEFAAAALGEPKKEAK